MADITEQETTYGLVVSFADLYPTDAEEHAFVHGTEFGRLWHRMRSGTEGTAEFRDTGEPTWTTAVKETSR